MCIVIVIIVFLFGSCNIQRTDFSSNETNIFGTKIDIGCFVGQSNDLIYFAPLLLYQDVYDNHLVTVFDTKNEQFVRRFLTIGRGPGEVTPPLRLFVSTVTQQIYAFQVQTGYLNVYEPDDIIDKNTIPYTHRQVFLEDRPIDVKKIKNGYVGIGMFDDGRFRLYDSIGNIVSSFGVYPFRGEGMSHIDRFFIYQGSLAASFDGNYFAIGTAFCDNLEFYRVEDGNAVLIKRYESYDVKAVFYGNRIRIDDNCKMDYMAAYGGKYCYMLYSGKTYLENERRPIGGSKIIVFDWNGNYLRSYSTDAVIFSFCVDEENNILYASALDDDDENEGGFCILQFNI